MVLMGILGGNYYTYDLISLSMCYLCYVYISKLKELLQTPTLPVVQLQNKGKKMENARVLTSNEFSKELEEKEKLKAEK